MMPDALVTTDAVYNFYEGSLAPEVRFTDVRLVDIGIKKLAFKEAPVFHDPHVTTGETYFLNFDHVEMIVSRGADFDVTPMQDQQFQDVFSAKVLWQAELTVSMRKALNKVVSQTA